jgi:replicative DNA helicase Mcm
MVEQVGYKYEEPFAGCENETCGKKGPFKLLVQESTFIDAQKLQIQEPPEDLRGTQAQSLDIDLDNDLTGILLPGERVIINGILKSRQRVLKDGKSTFYDILIEANSIERLGTAFDELEITSDDEEEIIELSKDPEVYDKAIASMAPVIKGYEDLKEAFLLQSMSGVSKTTDDGNHLRGDTHILIVGDPSMGKSVMSKSIQNRSPRCIFTSGKSASAGGLTAIVTKDDKFGEGRWTIEAGALVLADKGLTIIDEGDKMKSHDRDSLHEAMEQQEINLAKAGIIATLKTRTSVIMIANPKYGKFDPYEEIADQINMPPSLLSRFDLIFVLRDKPDKVKDAEISNHILLTHTHGEIKSQYESINKEVKKEDIGLFEEKVKSPISAEFIKKWVAYARKNCFPVMSKDARDHIHNCYLNMRDGVSDKTKSIPITTRQEEAMIRLAEAAARVQLSPLVRLEDAERATRLMIRCLKSVGYDKETGEYDGSVLNGAPSKDQRTAIKELKTIIKNLSTKHSQGKVPVVEVIAEAELAGISRPRITKTLEKLATAGDLIQFGKEHVKLTA